MVFDFEKAFDAAQLELVVERLKRMKIDAPDLRVQTNLYWEWGAVARVGEERS